MQSKIIGHFLLAITIFLYRFSYFCISFLWCLLWNDFICQPGTLVLPKSAFHNPKSQIQNPKLSIPSPIIHHKRIELERLVAWGQADMKRGSFKASLRSLRNGESSGERRALRLRTKVIQNEQYLKMFFSNYYILEV